MKKIKTPAIRYPGGCFADSYDWRDGVGDRANRPRRTNFWYGAAGKDVPLDSTTRIEPNQFGTNEFMHFCRLTGSKPYMAANLRGLPWIGWGQAWLGETREPARAGSEDAMAAPRS